MSTKTARISSKDLSAYAEQGIQRALEAREAVGTELTQEELDLISGGAGSSILRDIGGHAGGPWFQLQLQNKASAINPVSVSLQGATLMGC